jgi:Tfp pilus assembly protein PilF
MTSIVLFTVLAMAKASDPWSDKPPTQEEFGSVAKLTMDSTLKKLTIEQQTQWKSHLADLEHQPQAAVATGAASQEAALLHAMGFQNESTVLSAWAVTRAPADATLASNYAAISCYPPYLHYAERLAPDDPIIQTNIGSCAMSDQHFDLARAAYEKALKKDPKHANALVGLIQLCMRTGDIKMAFEYAARANGVTVRRAPQLISRQDEEGKPVPPAEPLEAGPGRFGGDDVGGSARVTDNEIHFPPFPNWPGPDAFIASAEKRKALAEFYGEKLGEGLQIVMDTMRDDPTAQLKSVQKRGTSPAEQDAAAFEAALKPAWNNTGVMAAIRANDAWARKQLEDLNKDYQATVDALAPMMEEIGKIGQARNDRFQAACGSPSDSNGPEAMARFKVCQDTFIKGAISSCKQSLALNGKLFAKWRDAYRAWYTHAVPVLERLYKVQAGWIRQIADPKLYQVALVGRSTAVFTPLGMKMTEEDVRRMMFLGVGAASLGSSAQSCPQEPPPPLQPEAASKPPTVTNPKQHCPLEGHPMTIPPISIPGIKLPISFVVGCKEAEMRVTYGFDKDPKRPYASAGAVLSMKHRFGGDKSTTVYVGVQGGLSASGPFGVGGGVNAEVGVSITFDRNGNPVDAGGKASFSEGAKLGAAYSGQIAVTAAIEKGAPDVTVAVNQSAAGKKQ